MKRARIVIPTCNRTEGLRRCIGALIPQIPDDDSVDILVCDDGSTDDSRRMLAAEFPSVEWQQGPRRGPSANRNLGAKVSDCQWLIYVDDDCLPRTGYVAAYLRAFEAAAQTSLFHGLTFPLPEIPSLLYEAPKLTELNKIFWSCNFAIRKSLFEATGGFDERYYLACFEDVEFSCRLELLGAKAECVEGAVVDHPLRPIQRSSKLAKRWEVRVVSTLDFGATPLQVAIRLPKHVLLVILSRFRGAKISPDNLRAAIIFSGEFLYFLCFLPGWLLKYAKVPRSRFWTEQDALGRAPARFGL
jgi:GT2 family glycosyltransferase